MPSSSVAIKNLSIQQLHGTSLYHRARRAWTSGLFISGAAAIAVALLGLIFSFDSLSGMAGGRLSIAGTILMAIMFPLLMLAAHCLDKIGEADKAIRLEYCRRNGLPD